MNIFPGMNILQLIVPLIFLAIWALTSLLTREAQPLPPRTTRPTGPGGPRPGTSTSGRMPERRGEPVTREAPVARWNSGATGTARPAPPRPASRDDEIVILEADTRRPASSRGESPRRSARSRPAAAPPARRAEPATTRSLSLAMAPDPAAQLNRTLELTPLTKMQLPLATSVTQEVAAPPPGTVSLAPPAALSSGEIRGLIASPAKLREAFVISEILKPPLALRQNRRGSS